MLVNTCKPFKLSYLSLVSKKTFLKHKISFFNFNFHKLKPILFFLMQISYIKYSFLFNLFLKLGINVNLNIVQLTFKQLAAITSLIDLILLDVKIINQRKLQLKLYHLKLLDFKYYCSVLKKPIHKQRQHSNYKTVKYYYY